MPTNRDEILEAVRELAETNESAPGARTFSNATGISRTDWLRYWPRWGDVLTEAGCQRNAKNEAYSMDFLFEQLAKLTIKLGHFPTRAELDIEARSNSDFPFYSTTLRRLGPKSTWPAQVAAFCQRADRYKEVVDLCEQLIPDSESDTGESSANAPCDEWVYLSRMGKGPYYKIGRTNSIERRTGEIRTGLPEEYKTIHIIRTDDSVGIERYWHQRFAEKRTKHEWFTLNATDIRAFKRRRFM